MESFDLLTEREKQIAYGVKAGCSNDEIGRILGIHPGSVRNHLRHIYAKLGITGPCHIRRTKLAIMIAKMKVRKRNGCYCSCSCQLQD